MSVNIIGKAIEDVICYRFESKAGDLVFVSNTLGDAAAGLALGKSAILKLAGKFSVLAKQPKDWVSS